MNPKFLRHRCLSLRSHCILAVFVPRLLRRYANYKHIFSQFTKKFGPLNVRSAVKLSNEKIILLDTLILSMLLNEDCFLVLMNQKAALCLSLIETSSASMFYAPMNVNYAANFAQTNQTTMLKRLRLVKNPN